jgi:hypothetical protein
MEAACRENILFIAVSEDSPVFGNLRGNKRLNRFTLSGATKVNDQWKGGFKFEVQHRLLSY